MNIVSKLAAAKIPTPSFETNIWGPINLNLNELWRPIFHFVQKKNYFSILCNDLSVILFFISNSAKSRVQSVTFFCLLITAVNQTLLDFVSARGFKKVVLIGVSARRAILVLVYMRRFKCQRAHYLGLDLCTYGGVRTGLRGLKGIILWRIKELYTY